MGSIHIRVIALGSYSDAFVRARQQEEARFNALRPELNAAITAVRNAGDDADFGAILDGVLPPELRPPLQERPGPGGDRRSFLHWLKKKRQLEWFSWYEDFTCELLQEALANARVTAPKNTLFIILLAESYFTDINDRPGHTTVSPFYEPVMQAFLNGTLPEVERFLVTRRLRNMSTDPDVVTFAGTVMWKRRIDEKEEVINTLPVFHRGDLVLLWDKQFTAPVDGVKELKRHPEMNPPDSIFHSGFTPRVNPMLSPSFRIPFRDTVIRFGVDICLDSMDGHRVMKACCPDPPDIHVVIAAGGSAKQNLYHAKKLFLLCDNGLKEAHRSGIVFCKFEGGSWSEVSFKPLKWATPLIWGLGDFEI
ncbi:hypothetical protein [Methanoculleus sp.]|uniref:hypothetical protein n=1 Tax=Methanoculleus sp. TaxID=90427 RepID=UPI001BD20054|nr:hypothetical protein [Methanoculleus sp.]